MDQQEKKNESPTPIPNSQQNVDVYGGDFSRAVLGDQNVTKHATQDYLEGGTITKIEVQAGNFTGARFGDKTVHNTYIQGIEDSSSDLEDTFVIRPRIRVYEKDPINAESRILRGKLLSEFVGNQDIVLKILSDDKYSKREAKMHFSIPSHPNIVHAIFADKFKYHGQSCTYIALELCDHLNLYSFVKLLKKQCCPFPAHLILSYVQHITEAIAFLHQHQIINRDLKPHNILLTADKTVAKLCDFGMCKPMEGDDTKMSRLHAGTLGWMSPEVLRGDPNISKSADVFSLGLIHYFLVSYGEHPFGKSLSDRNYYIRHNFLPHLNDIKVLQPKLFRKLLFNMLLSEASSRPSSEEVKNAVEQLATTCLVESDASEEEDKESIGSPSELNDEDEANYEDSQDSSFKFYHSSEEEFFKLQAARVAKTPSEEVTQFYDEPSCSSNLENTETTTLLQRSVSDSFHSTTRDYQSSLRKTYTLKELNPVQPLSPGSDVHSTNRYGRTIKKAYSSKEPYPVNPLWPRKVRSKDVSQESSTTSPEGSPDTVESGIEKSNVTSDSGELTHRHSKPAVDPDLASFQGRTIKKAYSSKDPYPVKPLWPRKVRSKSIGNASQESSTTSPEGSPDTVESWLEKTDVTSDSGELTHRPSKPALDPDLASFQGRTIKKAYSSKEHYPVKPLWPRKVRSKSSGNVPQEPRTTSSESSPDSVKSALEKSDVMSDSGELTHRHSKPAVNIDLASFQAKKSPDKKEKFVGKLMMTLGRKTQKKREVLHFDKQGPRNMPMKSMSKTERQLNEEINVMMTLQHKNVMQLYSRVTDQFVLEVEYMDYGSLSFFVQSKDGMHAEQLVLLEIAKQIATGMAYIASKIIVHRDLQACNIYVDRQQNCKIGGFHFAKRLEGGKYVCDEDDLINHKLTDPEVFEHHVFTKESDIWSFGMLLNEICTQEKPYPDLTPEEIRNVYQKGSKLPNPGIPNQLYKMMLDCWNNHLEQRPTFEHLKSLLKENISEERQSPSYTRF